MIPFDRLLVTRRHSPATSSLPTVAVRLLWRLSLSRPHSLIHASIALLLASLPSSDTAVALLPTVTTLLLRGSDVVICYPASCFTAIVGYGLVGIGGLGVFGDDVPSVQETWDVPKHAEEDVDERISGAETGFDPDYGVLVGDSE